MQPKTRTILALSLICVSLFAAASLYWHGNRSEAQGGMEPRTVTPTQMAPSTRPMGIPIGGASIAAMDGNLYIVEDGKVYMLNAATLEVVKSATYRPRALTGPSASAGGTPARRITQPEGGNNKQEG